MASQSGVLERPVQQALERGTKTLQTIFRKLRPKQLGALQTTSNEATFLIEVARLAVESGFEDRVESDFHQARLRALARVAELRKMAEPCLDTGQVCKLLGVSRETIRKKVDRKQLLALPKGSEDRVFPAFQFKEGELLPGMKEVLEVLPGDSPFVALSFLLSRSPFFRNKTAVDALKAGMLKEVIAEAGSYLEHGS